MVFESAAVLYVSVHTSCCTVWHPALPQTNTMPRLPVNAAAALTERCTACMHLSTFPPAEWFHTGSTDSKTEERVFIWVESPFLKIRSRNSDSSYTLRRAQVCLKHTLMVCWLGVIQNLRALLGSVGCAAQTRSVSSDGAPTSLV